MKTVLAASAASALLLAGTSLAAQEIDPRCLVAAEREGVSQGYNVRYDGDRRACIATPLPGTAMAPGVAAGLAGLGGGAGVAAGVVVIGVLAAVSTTGGT